jgi:hypothetical protein
VYDDFVMHVVNSDSENASWRVWNIADSANRIFPSTLFSLKDRSQFDVQFRVKLRTNVDHVRCDG